MGLGVIVGVFWGLVVSGLVVLVLSLSAPLPPGVSDGRAPATASVPSGPTETATEDTAPADTRPGDAAGAATETAPPAEDPPAIVADGDADTDTDTDLTDATAPASVDTGAADGAAAGAAVPPALAALRSAQPGPDIRAPASEVPLPAGSEFNRPPPEEPAALPGSDGAPMVRTPEAPPALDGAVSAGPDTTPAPQPRIVPAPSAPRAALPETGQVETPRTMAEPTVAPTSPPGPVPTPAPDRAATADAASVVPPAAPSALGTPAPAPEAVAEETAPQVVAENRTGAETGPPTPAPTGSASMESGQIDPGPARPADDDAPALEETVPQTAPPAVVRLIPPRTDDDPATPETDGRAEAEAASAEAGTGMPGAQTAPPRILRPGAASGPASGDAASPRAALPQIVSPARTEPAPPDASEALAETPPADMVEDAGAAADLPALAAFAAPFDASDPRALMALVLIDEPDARLDLDTLTRFGFPVAFAIDPTRPDAAERARAFRDAGFEVLLIGAAIPEGATASDTEVALSAARQRVPEAVALMDTTDSRIQADRSVLEAVVGIAAGEGQGFVAFPRGLNTAEQMAARAGVPAATLFRLLDDEDQRATVITRYLARAEFAAVQQGAVIVAGRTRPDTVTALFSWALGNRNEGVAIAPVSAVLQRLAQPD